MRVAHSAFSHREKVADGRMRAMCIGLINAIEEPGGSVKTPEAAMKRSAVSVLVLVLVLVPGCQGITKLDGEVVGTDGKPIAGVQILLIEPDDTALGCATRTDQAGRYSVTLSHAPFNITLAFTATKDGYEPYFKGFNSGDSARFPKSIVLEKAKIAPTATKM